MLQLQSVRGLHEPSWMPYIIRAWKQEGLRRIYQGSSVSIAVGSLRSGILFSTSNGIAAVLQDRHEIHPTASVALGATSGCVLSIFCSHPLYCLSWLRQPEMAQKNSMWHSSGHPSSFTTNRGGTDSF